MLLLSNKKPFFIDILKGGGKEKAITEHYLIGCHLEWLIAINLYLDPVYRESRQCQ